MYQLVYEALDVSTCVDDVATYNEFLVASLYRNFIITSFKLGTFAAIIVRNKATDPDHNTCCSP